MIHYLFQIKFTSNANNFRPNRKIEIKVVKGIIGNV